MRVGWNYIRVETNCVDRIEFEANGLGGILPFELKDLDDLRFLILERGTTQGTIPVEFGDIEDLVFLDLDFNQLEGTIPEQIYAFTNLVQLDLNNNFLSGTISPQIGNLRNLVFFQISENKFSGSLPAEISQLTSLVTGSFEMNEDLVGSLEGLCAIIRTKPRYTLIADCNPEQPGLRPRVQCSCCTQCFPIQ